MTNEELIYAIREGDKDNSLLIELWTQNAGVVRKACREYRGRIEEEDAAQECFFAFLDAVKEYDHENGGSFAGYFYKRCQWHLARHIDNCGYAIRIPAYQRQAINRYRRFIRRWYQDHGNLPDDPAICGALQITLDQLDQLRKDMQAARVRSIDVPLSDDDEGATVADMIPDSSAEIEADAIGRLFDQERRRAVWGAVDSLDDPEGDAVRLYYLCQLTHNQAAEVMGTTPGVIRARIEKGIRHLRAGKRGVKLRQYIDQSPLYCEAIKRCGIGAFNRTWTSSTESVALREVERYEELQRDIYQAEQLRKALQIARGEVNDPEGEGAASADSEIKKVAGDAGSEKTTAYKPL